MTPRAGWTLIVVGVLWTVLWMLAEPHKDTLPTVPDNAFTIVALPDTEEYADAWPQAFNIITQWLVDHQDDQRIVFVTHVGDIVDQNIAHQWNNAYTAMTRLDNRIPYAFSVGNHDMEKPTGKCKLFQETFPTHKFQSKKWYAGNHEDNTASYQVLTSNNIPILLLHLPCNAPDRFLEWANQVLESHPDHWAIITTHMYLGPIEKPTDSNAFLNNKKGRMAWIKCYTEPAPGSDKPQGNNAQQMWEKCFSQHPNVFLIICGDQSKTQTMHQEAKGRHGNLVHQTLCDYREGYIRLFRFLPDQDAIDVITYSPVYQRLCRETEIVSDPREHLFSLHVPFSKGVPTKNKSN